MTDINDAIHESVARARESRLNTAVAVLVAVSATFMAVCNVKDGNIVQAMAQEQAASIDAWSYYQAKSTKQHITEGTLDQISIERDTAASLTPQGHALLDAKFIEYGKLIAKYEIEKGTIRATAEGHQRQYDALNIHDDQFDMAEASLSVSLAIYGITALTQKRWLLAVAIVLSAFGTALGLAGFLGSNFHPDALAKLLG